MKLSKIISRDKKSSKKQNDNPVIDWPDYVITLDKKTLKPFIEKYPLSLVDFWAPWCKPCKAMTPRLRRLSKIYKGKVAFGRINTQENENVSKKYKIMGIPNFMFFSYGKKVASATGVKSVGDIKETIDSLLKKT